MPTVRNVEEWRPVPPKDNFPERESPSFELRRRWADLLSTARWWGWSRIVTAALCVPLVGFGGYFLLRSPAPPVESSLSFATTLPTSSTFSVSAKDIESDATQVTVHVAGNVMSPGVYRFVLGSRVVDAVRAAGGATSSADLNAINLAGLLDDGGQVYVPAIGERPAGTGNSTDTTSAIRLPLDVNSATAEELDVLPGIGPATAAVIVAHRERHGPFVSIEGLLEVAGIGPAKLAALTGLIKV